jgi:hypothetical protein
MPPVLGALTLIFLYLYFFFHVDLRLVEVNKGYASRQDIALCDFLLSLTCIRAKQIYLLIFIGITGWALTRKKPAVRQRWRLAGVTVLVLIFIFVGAFILQMNGNAGPWCNGTSDYSTDQ